MGLPGTPTFWWISGPSSPHTQLETPCWLYELSEGMLSLCLMQFCGFYHQPHFTDERTESRSKVTA